MPRSRAAARTAPDARHGDLVIRALVRARLLGIRLLTLEARVVLGPEDGLPAIAATRAARPGPGAALPAGWSAASGPAAPLPVSGQLARAVQLVDQGARTLDQSRTGKARDGT